MSESSNKYNKLTSDVIIYTIGNLGTKIINFILIPIYTSYLSSEKYGEADLVFSTVAMLLPIISACIYDAVLRYILDKTEDKSSILSNAFVGTSFSLIIFAVIYSIANYYMHYSNYGIYIVISIAVEAYEAVFSQYLRAIGETKKFAIKGIILAISSGVISLIGIIVLDLGVKGYLIGYILSYVISILYIIFSSDALTSINFKKTNLSTIKKLYRYSLPLVPNNTIWWAINSSSKYFIKFNHGTNANGLFAVASKIPALINMVTSVFTQAWQVSAISEYETEDKEDFYSNVFNMLASILFVSGLFILLFLKLIFHKFFPSSYFTAWKAVPLLILGAIFSSFSGFLGTIYIASKTTTSTLKTSALGGIITVALNAIIIPKFGIVGASVSNALGFLVMWIIRIFDSKKILNVKIKYKTMIPNLVLYLLTTALLFLNIDIKLQEIAAFVMFVLAVFINLSELKSIFKMLKSLFQKKKSK